MSHSTKMQIIRTIAFAPLLMEQLPLTDYWLKMQYAARKHTYALRSYFFISGESLDLPEDAEDIVFPFPTLKIDQTNAICQKQS